LIFQNKSCLFCSITMIVILVLILALSVSQGFHMRKCSTKSAMQMTMVALPDGPAMLRKGLSRGLTQGRKLLATGVVTFSSLMPQQKVWVGGVGGRSAPGVTRIDSGGRNNKRGQKKGSLSTGRKARNGVGMKVITQVKPLSGGRRQAGTASSFVRDSVMSVGPR
jgi:hypothetical protein